MKMKRFLAMIVAMCMMLALLPVSAFAASPVVGGYCGYSVQWMLYSDGVLQIYGAGEMDNYDWETPAPWAKYAGSITSIKVVNGVTSVGDFAFNGCYNATSASIGFTVTSIGMSAFGECSQLREVAIPEGVTTIGFGAFNYCTALERIDIPASVTELGGSAFSGCSSLTSIAIPSGVTSIGYGTFSECENLREIDLPDTLTEIGGDAFMHCTSLTQIDIPENVTYIGFYAFACSGLTSVTIPAGVTELGMDVFYECMDLTHVTYGSNAPTEDSLFRACENLTEVVFLDGVHTIYDHALWPCEALTTVTIPVSVTEIGYGAFYWCIGLTDAYYGGTEEQWSQINIKEDNDRLLNATIHYQEAEDDGLIDSGTCGENLTWTLDEEGLLKIFGTGEMDRFTRNNPAPWAQYTDSILAVEVHSGVTSISNNAFNGCANAVYAKLGDTVVSIGECAFSDCTGLTEVSIPDSVTQMSTYAFSGCTSLREIVIPGGLTRIPDSAFMGCSGLKTIVIRDGVTTIGDFAFGYTGVTAVTIPVSVTTIESAAFFFCYSLTDVYYGGTEEQWSQINIKEDNDWLLNATIHFKEAEDDGLIDSGTCGENVFWELDRDGLLKIYGNGAMADYSEAAPAPWNAYADAIKTVEICEGVTHIGESAFRGCAMTVVYIPVSVTCFGAGSFYGCEALDDVYYGGTEAQWREIENYLNEHSIGCATIHYYRNLADLGTCGENISWELYRDGLLTIYGTGEMTDYTWRESAPWTKFLVLVQRVEISNGITSIGDRAFHGCSFLEQITIPASVTRIGAEAFFDCQKLTDVVIPDGVTVIETYTFGACRALETVTIPDSVVEIQDNVFYLCDSLTDVYYSGSQEEWDAIRIGEGNPLLTAAAIHVNPFYDVDDSAYFYQPIRWAIEAGITNGTSLSTFDPEAKCTREQIVTFLWRAAGKPEPTLTENPFEDVTTGSYAYKAILWALENGITTGTSATTFGLQDACTREQVATFLWRAAGKPMPESTENIFTDLNENNFGYYPILWAAENGITTGYGNGLFGLNDTCTRGQIVTFLYRAFAES